MDLAKLSQFILDVAGRDQPGSFLAIECGGSRINDLLQAYTPPFIAVCAPVRRHDIKQQAGNANVGEMGGNFCPPHARAEHTSLTDPVPHSYAILSIVVSTPCTPPLQ